VAVEEVYTMTREAIESAIQAYRTIEAQCKELIAFYERELKKLEDLKSDQDSSKI
jgi:hypothetical protein